MTKKRILLAILCMALLYVGYRVYSFALAPRDQLRSMDLIPADAVFILESAQPTESWEQIAQGKALKHLENKGYLSRLTENIQRVDRIFDQNSELLGGSSLYFSLHMVGPRDYGVLCILDLDGISKGELVKTAWRNLFDQDLAREKWAYNGHEILEVVNQDSGGTMALSFVHDKLVVSNTASLVEASIDQYRDPVLGRNLQFLDMADRVGRESLFRLYLQFEYLDDYVDWYSDSPSTWAHRASEEFDFTGFHFFLDHNNTFTANGFTNLKPVQNHYLDALMESGRAPRGIADIAPARTGLYLSYGFDGFENFYDNFERLQQRDPGQFKNFQKEVRELEQLLDIDLRENIVPWVGEEIGLLQIQSHLSQGKGELALVLKTKDEALARAQLDLIMERVRKKTPAKFTTVEYKGHSIKFLTLKGFFKLLFKGRFSEVDKPYFTMIDGHVIFSEDPNTLKGIIDDLLQGETLGASEAYRAFDKNFEEESTIFAYSNVPLLYDGLYAWLKPTSHEQLERNRDLIDHFPRFGFQLIPRDGVFGTRLVVDYRNFPELVDGKGIGDSQGGPEPASVEGPTEAVFDLGPIYPSDLTADRYATRFNNGNTRFELGLKDGLKHGSYTEYWPNGQKKITGRFKADRQVGNWRYFDREGKLVLKKNF